jgi:hypothetical protein
MTNYRTVRGPNTAFPGDKGVKIAENTDDTSNTITVVEVPDARAGVWTRPEDLGFDERNPLSGLILLACGRPAQQIQPALQSLLFPALAVRHDLQQNLPRDRTARGGVGAGPHILRSVMAQPTQADEVLWDIQL